MEITATQIIIGVVVILFAAWVVWISNSAVDNKNSILVMTEANKAVVSDLSKITDQIEKVGEEMKADFRHFKEEVRGDIRHMSMELSVFTKDENDVLKELLRDKK